MSDFNVIETQEQLDAVIGDRLKRNEEKWQRKYEGYLSPEEVAKKTADLEAQLSASNTALEDANKKTSDMEKTMHEYDAKIRGFEVSAMKNRIAHESGLSFDAIDFLQGEDEETIKASAEKFKALVGRTHSAPGLNSEPGIADTKNASIKKLAQSLTK